MLFLFSFLFFFNFRERPKIRLRETGVFRSLKAENIILNARMVI